jgi:putative transposase
MPHTYASIRVHVIFSTNERRRLIKPELQRRLWGYLGHTANNLNIPVLAIGGVEDHAHLGLCVPPNLKLAEIVQKLKANSSRWMNTEHVRGFEWQLGYAAFSVSISHTNALIKYINQQPEHHKRISLDEELEKILRKHGLSLSELPGHQNA